MNLLNPLRSRATTPARLAMDYGTFDGHHTNSGGCYDLDYNQWHVHVREDDGQLSVRVQRNCQDRWGSGDSWFSRSWLRDDFKTSWSRRKAYTKPKPHQLNRAIDAAWAWCDRQNKREDEAKQAVESVTAQV